MALQFVRCRLLVNSHGADEQKFQWVMSWILRAEQALRYTLSASNIDDDTDDEKEADADADAADAAGAAFFAGVRAVALLDDGAAAGVGAANFENNDDNANGECDCKTDCGFAVNGEVDTVAILVGATALFDRLDDGTSGCKGN